MNKQSRAWRVMTEKSWGPSLGPGQHQDGKVELGPACRVVSLVCNGELAKKKGDIWGQKGHLEQKAR